MRNNVPAVRIDGRTNHILDHLEAFAAPIKPCFIDERGILYLKTPEFSFIIAVHFLALRRRAIQRHQVVLRLPSCSKSSKSRSPLNRWNHLYFQLIQNECVPLNLVVFGKQ